MSNQTLSFLLCVLCAFWSCEDESDNSVPEPEPIITFEKDIDNIKLRIDDSIDNLGGDYRLDHEHFTYYLKILKV